MKRIQTKKEKIKTKIGLWLIKVCGKWMSKGINMTKHPRKLIPYKETKEVTRKVIKTEMIPCGKGSKVKIVKDKDGSPIYVTKKSKELVESVAINMNDPKTEEFIKNLEVGLQLIEATLHDDDRMEKPQLMLYRKPEKDLFQPPAEKNFYEIPKHKTPIFQLKKATSALKEILETDFSDKTIQKFIKIQENENKPKGYEVAWPSSVNYKNISFNGHKTTYEGIVDFDYAEKNKDIWSTNKTYYLTYKITHIYDPKTKQNGFSNIEIVYKGKLIMKDFIEFAWVEKFYNKIKNN